MKYESLRYFDICKQELGRNYRFFFDAVDVIRILQGVHRFYKGDRAQLFDIELFDEDASLVHALAFGKFLKQPIHLLPTHQAELSRVIKDGRDGRNYTFYNKSDHILKRFLEKDLKFFDKLRDMTNPGNIQENGVDEAAIKSWIEDKNKEIFKAIFLSYKASYVERLQELFNSGIVQIENYEFDDIRIHDDELFIALSDAFRSRRPGKEDSGSNFSDVAALMFLSRMVKEYNEDNTRPLPVYFDSHSYLEYFSEDIMDAYFKINTRTADGKEGLPSYALRNHDFFRLFALESYSRGIQLKDDDISYGELIKSGASADNLQKSFDNTTRGKGITEVRKWFKKGNETLRSKIINYIEVDFFKAILSALQKDRPEILNQILLDFQKKELNPESTEVINKQNDIILQYINTEINDLLRETVNIYNEIQRRIRAVTTVVKQLKEENQELDIFYHFSLFRFLIPRKYQVNLKYFFSDSGLLSTDSPNFSRLTLWNLYYRTAFYKHNKKVGHGRLLDMNELYLLYGSFWTLSLQDRLIDFNAQKKYLEPLDHSLLMLIGACLDRVIVGVKAGDPEVDRYRKLYKTIINVLEERVSNSEQPPSDEENRNQAKIVLSYLYFHLWVQEGNAEASEINFDTSRIIFAPGNANYKAVQLAREALTYYENKDVRNNTIYLYAFNIYVYYVIDTASDEEFRNAGAFRNKFIGLQSSSRDWHFRYDDTIARNFHRLSAMVSSPDSKLEYLNKAIHILEASLKKYRALEGKDIGEVRAYLNTLVNIKGELELAEAR